MNKSHNLYFHVHSDKAYTLDDVVRVTIYALIIFISSLIFFVLITVILTRPQLRRCFRNHQLISAALGGIVFSLLVRPGTINVDLYINLAPPKEYCNLFYFLSDFEVVFLPVTLLLMTTMTIVAEKGDMEDKLKWWHKGGILIGPWMISGIFAVFRRYVLLYDDSYGNQYRPPIYYKGCEHGYVLGINRGSVITWVITLCGLTVSLFLALVVLLVRHCYTNRPRNEPVNTLELAPIEQQPSETSVVKAPSTQWRRVAMVTVVDIMMIVVATLNVCLKVGRPVYF